MRLFCSLVALALLLPGCKLTERSLTRQDERNLKYELVQANRKSISIIQGRLFLATRFGTEERTREAMDRMIHASAVQNRAALRGTGSTWRATGTVPLEER
ncbi:MAG: hypothetical protein O7H41_04165 [Planctomycetota bacterium]|nr:hypothetical protein [Planctomycetota bacterium]